MWTRACSTLIAFTRTVKFRTTAQGDFAGKSLEALLVRAGDPSAALASACLHSGVGFRACPHVRAGAERSPLWRETGSAEDAAKCERSCEGSAAVHQGEFLLQLLSSKRAST